MLEKGLPLLTFRNCFSVVVVCWLAVITLHLTGQLDSIAVSLFTNRETAMLSKVNMCSEYVQASVMSYVCPIIMQKELHILSKEIKYFRVK